MRMGFWKLLWDGKRLPRIWQDLDKKSLNLFKELMSRREEHTCPCTHRQESRHWPHTKEKRKIPTTTALHTPLMALHLAMEWSGFVAFSLSSMCYSCVLISVPLAPIKSWPTTAIESTFGERNRMELNIRAAQQQNRLELPQAVSCPYRKGAGRIQLSLCQGCWVGSLTLTCDLPEPRPDSLSLCLRRLSSHAEADV